MRKDILFAAFLILLCGSVFGQSVTETTQANSIAVCASTCYAMSHQCDCYQDGYVDCKLKNLTSIPSPMPECAKRISISRNRITDLEIGDFEGLVEVHTIEITKENITEIPSGVFSDLSALVRLILSNNQIRSVEECAFEGLSSLQTLRLSANRIATLDSRSFRGLSSLHTLYLDRNQLVALEPRLFEGLSSLRYVHLENNALTGLHSGALAGLSSLESINIYNNRFAKLDVQWFEDVNNLTLIVGQNPWNCTCAHKRDYSYILRTFNTTVHCPLTVQEIEGSFFNHMCVICSHPSYLKDHMLQSVSLSNFTDCESTYNDNTMPTTINGLASTTEEPFNSDGTSSVPKTYCETKVSRLKQRSFGSARTGQQSSTMPTQSNPENTTAESTATSKSNLHYESTATSKSNLHYESTATSKLNIQGQNTALNATKVTTVLSTFSDESKPVATWTIIVIVVVILLVVAIAVILAIYVIRKSERRLVKVEPPTEATEMHSGSFPNETIELEANGK